jgi:hypothetical protein
MSLDIAIMNLAQNKYYLELLYIAVSYIRMAAELIFEKLFDFDYFKHKESEILQDQEADFILRSG